MVTLPGQVATTVGIGCAVGALSSLKQSASSFKDLLSDPDPKNKTSFEKQCDRFLGYDTASYGLSRASVKLVEGSLWALSSLAFGVIALATLDTSDKLPLSGKVKGFSPITSGPNLTKEDLFGVKPKQEQNLGAKVIQNLTSYFRNLDLVKIQPSSESLETGSKVADFAMKGLGLYLLQRIRSEFKQSLAQIAVNTGQAQAPQRLWIPGGPGATPAPSNRPESGMSGFSNVGSQLGVQSMEGRSIATSVSELVSDPGGLSRNLNALDLVSSTTSAATEESYQLISDLPSGLPRGTLHRNPRTGVPEPFITQPVQLND